jgi:Spy/CpxP family protein refolding chaperone
MKKIIAVALLSAAVAAPTFADDTSAQASTKKSVPATSSGHKQGHKMGDMKDGCDGEHDMGGHHGYGMMGERDADMMMEPNMHMLRALDLSQEQQSKINKLSDDLKHNNWATQGLINDETAKLRDLYEADKRDPATIGKEYQKVFDLKRQMIETYLETQNRIEEILTPEQRAKMKEARHNMHRMYEQHPMK